MDGLIGHSIGGLLFALFAALPFIIDSVSFLVSGALNHASIIDGCRLSRANIKIYEHNDMDSLRSVLQEECNGRRLIITDGVFSMDADLARLPEIVDLAEKFGVMTYVDDANGEGVLGSHGRGIVDHFGLHGRVDVEIGTLSKTFGCVGGFAAGSARLVEENTFAQSIGFPVVPRGTGRIRVIISAAHSTEDLDFAVDTFEKVGREMELI